MTIQILVFDFRLYNMHEVWRLFTPVKQCMVCLQHCMREGIPYSGLFSWVEIFVKSWKRLPELNFVVLIFVAWNA